MRSIALVGLAVSLLVPAISVAAATDRSQCDSVEAHHTVDVSSGGRHANPDGVAGWPSQPGCELAYVVDFDSGDRRMNSFVPDRDWVKNPFNGISCVAECLDVEYLKYRAVVDVYRCTSPRRCAHDRFSKVGSYAVRYGEAIRPPRCAPLLAPGDSVPTARNAYGVRLVVKYQIVRYVDLGTGQCERAPVPMPRELGFNASGTAGFPRVGPLEEEGRPRAEPIG